MSGLSDSGPNDIILSVTEEMLNRTCAASLRVLDVCKKTGRHYTRILNNRKPPRSVRNGDWCRTKIASSIFLGRKHVHLTLSSSGSAIHHWSKDAFQQNKSWELFSHPWKKSGLDPENIGNCRTISILTFI